MKVLFLAFFVVTFVTAFNQDDLKMRYKFNDFVEKYNKKYETTEEFMDRLKVFTENVKEIEAHNNRRDISWRKGINQFSDLTAQEFKAIHASGLVNVVKRQSDESNYYSSNLKPMSDLPESKDWRDEGIISDVRAQGNCGSCWAFATAEQLESYLALKTGKLTSISPQHITSCAPNPLKCGGTGGCYGSLTEIGFTYAQLMGVLSEEDFPYTSGETGETGECTYDANTQTAAVYVRGYETLPHNSLEAVMNHVATVGPLGISVDASVWHSYEGGIFDGCSYEENIEINHGVQLVGYGTDAETGTDYWIVRNSWGPEWGENGFIRLKRESEAVCGTDSTPMMGTACEGDGNAVQKVCGMCGVLFDTTYPIGADSTSGIKP